MMIFRLTLSYLVIQAEDHAKMNMRVTILKCFTTILLTMGCFNHLTAATVWCLKNQFAS